VVSIIPSVQQCKQNTRRVAVYLGSHCKARRERADPLRVTLNRLISCQRFISYVARYECSGSPVAVVVIRLTILIIGIYLFIIELYRRPRKGADGHRYQPARLRQFSEVQKNRDLDLDLGSGQGHSSIHNTCSTISVPNCLTVASRNTEILSFEFREISTLPEV